MLKLGEKGTILQRDKETYAIAPHIPCGVTTPEQLRTIADVAEKYQCQTLKLTSASSAAAGGGATAAVSRRSGARKRHRVRSRRGESRGCHESMAPRTGGRIVAD